MENADPKQRTYQGDDGYRYAKLTMTWYGWGSPVGLGLFFVLIGLFIYLLHIAHIIGK